MLTNSAKLANTIEAPNCRITEDVIREMEKEANGDDWGGDKRGFEQLSNTCWKRIESEPIGG